VLDNSGKSVAEIANDSQNIYKAVAISPTEQIVLGDYDLEAQKGKLMIRSAGKTSVIKEVEHAYSVFANESAILLIYQKENSYQAEVIDYRGKTRATVLDVDPTSVAPVADGFYFATKPGDLALGSNYGGGLGFVANSGAVKNIISSVEESETQYNFANTQVTGDYLYARDGDKIVRIKI